LARAQNGKINGKRGGVPREETILRREGVEWGKEVLPGMDMRNGKDYNGKSIWGKEEEYNEEKILARGIMGKRITLRHAYA